MEEDADRIFEAYAQDPEVTKYMIWKPYTNKQDMEKWLSGQIDDFRKKEENCYVLCLKEDNYNVIGMATIRMSSYVADIGYVLERKHWGKGIMPEALSYLVNWAMEQEEIYIFLLRGGSIFNAY